MVFLTYSYLFIIYAMPRSINQTLFRIDSFWKKIDLKPLLIRAFEADLATIPTATVIDFAVWAINRSSPVFISHVVAIDDGKEVQFYPESGISKISVSVFNFYFVHEFLILNTNLARSIAKLMFC